MEHEATASADFWNLSLQPALAGKYGDFSEAEIWSFGI